MNLRWRRAVMQAALLLMESLWAYALVAFLVALTVDGSRPTVFGTGAVVFASFAISRALQNSELSLGILRAWGVGLSLLLFYGIVRVDFFGDGHFWDFTWADDLFNRTEASLRDKATAVIGIPLLWALWMRGVMRGQQLIMFEPVVNSFALGVLIMAFVQLFAGAVDAPEAVRLVAVPYIAIGLLAVALAHAARAEEEAGRSFGTTWLIAVGGSVLSIAAISLLFVVLDFGALREALGDVSLQLTTWVLGVLAILEWPISQLFNGLYDFLFWLVNLYGGTRQEPQPLPEEGLPEEQEESEPRELPAWLDLLIRIFIGGIIAAAVVLVLAILFTRFWKRPRLGEAKETTYTEGRLVADIGGLLGSLIGRVRPRFRFGGEQLEPAQRLYFEMLDAASRRGVERRPPETPLELAPRLERTFMTDAPDRITGAFDDSRYGRAPPPAEEVQRLREEWERARR